ncbi:MAG: nitrate/nitrite transporter NrtS [Gammaproteobacteria bacterium]
MKDWLKTAVRPDILRRSLLTALVVGTLLALINHGDRLLAGGVDRAALTKILLSYAVPFAVSSCSAVQALRR